MLPHHRGPTVPDGNGEIINRNFADIFAGDVRYVIPFFQRGYVWNSRNWNQLKQDIDEQILEPGQNACLAVIVAEKTGHPRFKMFDIIDGQQRFTTVYLMLAHFRRRLETLMAKAPKSSRAPRANRKVADQPSRLLSVAGRLLANQVVQCGWRDFLSGSTNRGCRIPECRRRTHEDARGSVDLPRRPQPMAGRP